jgi:hypothetical protein
MPKSPRRGFLARQQPTEQERVLLAAVTRGISDTATSNTVVGQSHVTRLQAGAKKKRGRSA